MISWAGFPQGSEGERIVEATSRLVDYFLPRLAAHVQLSSFTYENLLRRSTREVRPVSGVFYVGLHQPRDSKIVEDQKHITTTCPSTMGLWSYH